MIASRVYYLALLVALIAAGCAGTEVIPGEPYTERDLVTDLAYDYLVATGEITPTLQAVPNVSVHVPRPCFGCPEVDEEERVEQWTVSFDLFDAFGEPMGYASTSVRRYTESGERRYEVGA